MIVSFWASGRKVVGTSPFPHATCRDHIFLPYLGIITDSCHYSLCTWYCVIRFGTRWNCPIIWNKRNRSILSCASMYVFALEENQNTDWYISGLLVIVSARLGSNYMMTQVGGVGFMLFALWKDTLRRIQWRTIKHLLYIVPWKCSERRNVLMMPDKSSKWHNLLLSASLCSDSTVPLLCI